MYLYHVASPTRYLTGFFLCLIVVVVTGTLQIVVVVVGGTVVVVVVVSPGVVVVELGSVVVVADVVVVVLGVQIGFERFFTVVVVVGLRTGFFALGRLVLTVRVTVACHLTRVPAAGAWCKTTIHFPSELPGPRVEKKSCALFIIAYVRAGDRPITRGTLRGACALAVDTLTVAWKCHGTTVPARGD
jgi:hypothetical protein